MAVLGTLFQLFLANILESESESLNLNSGIDGLLGEAIRDLPQLEIWLRADDDVANPYVQWFLHQSKMPVSIFTYKEEEEEEDFLAPNPFGRNNLALVMSLNQLISNRGAAASNQKAGVFFYILADQREDLTDEEQLRLENSCRQLWMLHKIYNRFFLTANETIWIYDPFKRRNSAFGRLVRYFGSEPLDKLLFRDMEGYPLRIQMFKSVYTRPEIDKDTGLLTSVTGVDFLVAQMLRERLNFTMLLQQPEKNYFGERYANGSYNGAIGSIIQDGLDICLTGFFVKDYLVQRYMDFTVAVYDDELCIYVPKASRIPQSILPIFAVGYDIWLGFILSAFACSLIWLTLRVINLKLRIVKWNADIVSQALGIVVDTWVVWVRLNLSHLPSSYAERMFIGTLCLVSVIFGAIFESSLATVYIHPLYYKDINTMQELDDSGLKVVYKYSSMADDLFFSETSPLFASLNSKLTWNRDLRADVIDEVARQRNKAGVSRYTSLILESSRFTLLRQIWVVPECPKYYTISYVMPRDSPWEDAVNALLLRFLSAGLIVKWIQDEKSRVDIRMRLSILEANAESELVRVLTIGDLQLAFYVVIGGNLLALLGFCVEHFWRKLPRNERK